MIKTLPLAGIVAWGWVNVGGSEESSYLFEFRIPRTVYTDCRVARADANSGALTKTAKKPLVPAVQSVPTAQSLSLRSNLELTSYAFSFRKSPANVKGYMCRNYLTLGLTPFATGQTSCHSLRCLCAFQPPTVKNYLRLRGLVQYVPSTEFILSIVEWAQVYPRRDCRDNSAT